MNTTRRGALSAVAAFATLSALAACSSSASLQATDAQIIADAKGLIPAVQSVIAAVVQYDPKMLSAAEQAKIAALEAAANAALNSLSAATPPASAAASLQTIDDYLNTALAAVGAALPGASIAFPALATYVPIYDAAVALVETVLEPYINSLVPAAKSAAARTFLYAVKKQYTAPEARSVLHIK